MRVHPPRVYVDDTGTRKGRGVFAGSDFALDEVVEIAPVVIFRPHDLPRIIATMLFEWGQMARVPNSRAIALGYGSLYNHANPANMRCEADVLVPAVRFIAARKISAGEELTINYNAASGGTEWPDDHWFKRYGIERI